MLNWRIACIVILLSFLLPASGCFTPKKGTAPADPLSSCTSACEKSFSHTVGNISNGTCNCPCEKGYQKYSGMCITLKEYDSLRPAICNSGCEANYPHSSGIIKNGTCTCPCKKGYVSYNRTCITPQEFRNLAPALCPKDFPVLKVYDWQYKQKSHYVALCYENEGGADVTEDRSRRKDYWNFVDDPHSNSSVSIVTTQLANISEREGFSKYERVEFAVAFVQSLPYTSDNVTTPYDEYPRFPSETIYADGGDCEDTSILMAAILKKMGYDVVLLDLPRHLATGVWCDPSDFDYDATAYPYNGRDYCYLETTGENWKIGELPESHAGQTVEVIPLRSAQPDIYLGWGRTSAFRYAYSYDSRHTYVNVTGIRIDNFGTAPAKNVKIYAALETTEAGKVWSQYTLAAGDIPARGYYEGGVTNLNAPSGESFRISVIVYGDNFKSVESKGGWFTWH